MEIQGHRIKGIKMLNRIKVIIKVRKRRDSVSKNQRERELNF